MASSNTESEDSEEYETGSEVEDDSHILSEPQKQDNLKKELEEEDRVSFCGITFLRKYYIMLMLWNFLLTFVSTFGV
jgi:hypothetical protein